MYPSEDRYTVSVYIAAPGTPLLDEDGMPQMDKDGAQITSLPGHMYYVTSNGRDRNSFGFVPIEHGRIDGPGKPFNDDERTYSNPLYARTMEITKAQYDTLNAFGVDPTAFGFDLYYKDLRHNCVDFTWAALNQAGIQREPMHIDVPAITPPRMSYQHIPLPGRHEGKASYRPAENVEDVRGLRDPIPNSPLNQERTNPMPEHRSLLQRLLSDNEPTQSPHVASITPDSSIDDMVDALYQAAITQDHAAMSAVSQAYLQSADGQAFLQLGRDYNQQQQMQQLAAQQQMTVRGPVMSL